MDGFLTVNKPQGLTSHDVVHRIRRWSGEKRVGHGGTLDPLATGVLPIALGYGTRLLEFVSGPKVYRAEIEFGKATDTYDAEGVVIAERDAAGLTEAAVREALAAFVGELEQQPPAFSAIKHEGKPLYTYARSGVAVAVPPRKVSIFRNTLLAWLTPVASIEVVCSKGTYVRSLAHDLGQVLGCGAFLKALVRTQDGAFTLDRSLELEELQGAFMENVGASYLLPMEHVVAEWPFVVLDAMQESRVLHGQPLPLTQVKLQYSGAAEHSPSPLYCRATSANGQMRAVLKRAPGSFLWEPIKVFPPHLS